MKNIKNVDDINDLRFTITEDMSNMFIEIITIRQMLKENKLNKKDIALFCGALHRISDAKSTGDYSSWKYTV